MSNFSQKSQVIIESFQKDRGELPVQESQELVEFKSFMKDYVRYKIVNEQIAGPINYPTQQPKRKNPEREAMLDQREIDRARAFAELEKKAKEDPFSIEAKQWDALTRPPRIERMVDDDLRSIDAPFKVSNKGDVYFNPRGLKEIITIIGSGAGLSKMGKFAKALTIGAGATEVPKIMDTTLGTPNKRDMFEESNQLDENRVIRFLIQQGQKALPYIKSYMGKGKDIATDVVKQGVGTAGDVIGAAAGRPMSASLTQTPMERFMDIAAHLRVAGGQGLEDVKIGGKTLLKGSLQGAIKGPKAIPMVRDVLTAPLRGQEGIPAIARLKGAFQGLNAAERKGVRDYVRKAREDESTGMVSDFIRGATRATTRTAALGEALPIAAIAGAEVAHSKGWIDEPTASAIGYYGDLIGLATKGLRGDTEKTDPILVSVTKAAIGKSTVGEVGSDIATRVGEYASAPTGVGLAAQATAGLVKSGLEREAGRQTRNVRTPESIQAGIQKSEETDKILDYFGTPETRKSGESRYAKQYKEKNGRFPTEAEFSADYRSWKGSQQ
jgi:hypothetical protein